MSTWDDAIAAIGQDFAGDEDHVADEIISSTDVARYCEPWEIGNPIYWDAEAAKRAGYRGIVVPWSAVKQTFAYRGFWRPGASTWFPSPDPNATSPLATDRPEGKAIPMPQTSKRIFTDMEIEFFEPVCVGDRITVVGNKLVSVEPKKTRLGFGAFIVLESELRNQRGERVARTRQKRYFYDRDPENGHTNTAG